MNQSSRQWLAIATAGVMLLTTSGMGFGAGRPAQAAARPTQATAQSRGGSFVSDEIIVKYQTPAGLTRAATVVDEKGLATMAQDRSTGAVLQRITDGRTPDQVAAALRAGGRVVYAQPNYIYTADSIDPRYGEQWGIKNTGQIVADWPGDGTTDVGAEAVWPTTRGSSNVIVAVIDGGADINHPDLAGRIWTNPGEVPGDGIDNDNDGFIDDVHGWDFYNGDATVDETNDMGVKHGTHVAGIIAAEADNSLGGTGVAPGVTVMPLKFLGPDNSGDTWNAIDAINYAKAHGAQIINASWGAPGGSSVDTALNDAIASSGLVFVAAAGNDTTDTDVTPHTPGSLGASNIITVAALGNEGRLASFSNWGATTVDVGAPGVDILSTLPQQPALGAAVGVPGKSAFWGFGLEEVAAAQQQSAISQTLTYLGVPAAGKVMLVEDDGSWYGPTSNSAYSAALMAAGYTVSAWPVTPGADGPTVTDIVYSNADAVVWFTGKDYSYAPNPPLLTANDQTTVTDYVYGGGKLFLSGRDASDELAGSALFTGTLLTNVTGENENAIAVAPSGGISAYSGTLDLTPADPWRDTVTAGTGADLLLEYPTTDYGYMSGTSMAAPFVSGVAALLKSAHPNATTDQIVQAILAAAATPADQMASLAGKTTTGGQVKAADALAKLDAIRATAGQVTAGGAVAPQGNRNFLYYSYDPAASAPSLSVTVTTPLAGTATAMRLAMGDPGLTTPAWGAWTSITPAASAAVSATVCAQPYGWGEQRVYVQFMDGNGVIGDPIASSSPVYVIGNTWIQTAPGVIPVSDPATPTDITVKVLGGDSGEWDLQGAEVSLTNGGGTPLSSPVTSDAAGTAVISGITAAAGTTEYVKVVDPSTGAAMAPWNASGVYFVDPAQQGALSVEVTGGATPIRVGSVMARKTDGSWSFYFWNAGLPRALPLPAGTYNVEVSAVDTSGQQYLLYKPGVTVTNGLTTSISVDATVTSTLTVQIGGKTEPAIDYGSIILHPTTWSIKDTLSAFVFNGTGTINVTPGSYDARLARYGTNEAWYSFAYNQDLTADASLDLRRDAADLGTVRLTAYDGYGRAGQPAMYFADRWSIGWAADAPPTTTIHMDSGTYNVYYAAKKWSGPSDPPAQDQIAFPTENLTVAAGVTQQVNVGGPLALDVATPDIVPGTTATLAVYAREATGARRSASTVWAGNQVVQPQMTITDKGGQTVYSGALPGLGSSTVDIPAGAFEAPYSIEATLDTGDYQGLLQFPPPPPPVFGGGGGSAPATSPGDWTYDDPNGTATLAVDPDQVTLPDGDTLTLDAEVPVGHSGVTEVTMKLPASLLSRLQEGQKALTVTALGVKVELGSAALSEAGSKLKSGEDLLVTVGQHPTNALQEPLAVATKEAMQLIGNVFNIEVARGSGSGGTPIEPFHSAVRVTLPYEGSPNTPGVGVYRFNPSSGSWEYRPSRVDDSGKNILFNTWEFSDYAVFALTKSFADMEGHWAKADVEWLADRGLVKGTGNAGSFSPDRPVTRAEFATMLVRALGIDGAGDAPAFSDVSPTAWYAQTVGAATRAGLVLGDGGQFRPDDAVTREEMAVMLQRAADLTGLATADGAAPGTTSTADSFAPFVDGGDVDTWAQISTAAAVRRQWLQGQGDRLAPRAAATRAESATILKRLLTSLEP